ncbi:MAG: hypothetical protein AAFV53_01110 [Myxococcota bacterium]
MARHPTTALIALCLTASSVSAAEDAPPQGTQSALKGSRFKQRETSDSVSNHLNALLASTKTPPRSPMEVEHNPTRSWGFKGRFNDAMADLLESVGASPTYFMDKLKIEAMAYNHYATTGPLLVSVHPYSFGDEVELFVMADPRYRMVAVSLESLTLAGEPQEADADLATLEDDFGLIAQKWNFEATQPGGDMVIALDVTWARRFTEVKLPIEAGATATARGCTVLIEEVELDGDETDVEFTYEGCPLMGYHVDDPGLTQNGAGWGEGIVRASFEGNPSGRHALIVTFPKKPHRERLKIQLNDLDLSEEDAS